MKILLLFLLINVWFLFSANLAHAQLAPPTIADEESGLDKVLVSKTNEVLYNMRWTYRRVTEGGKKYIQVTVKGDNDKKGATRIDWAEESKYEETAGGLRPLYWKKSSTGAEQMDWEVRYNHAGGKAIFTFSDRMTGKKESKTIALTKDTIPGEALYLLLRGFPFEKGEGTTIKGQVLQGNDGSLTGGNLIHRGEERLTTPLGTFDTYKLELKPTGLYGMLPTKLYMWFTKDAPHRCVRFDGIEDITTRTKTVLYQHQAK